MSWLWIAAAVVAIWVALSVLVVCVLCTISATSERARALELEARELLDVEAHVFHPASVRVGGVGDVVDLDERRRLRSDAAQTRERRESS